MANLNIKLVKSPVSYTHLHKRLIDITKSSPKTVEALMALELPAGVEIEIKL